MSLHIKNVSAGFGSGPHCNYNNVVEIYHDILNDNTLTILPDSSPHEFGASSLQSTLLVTRLEEKFGVSISMKAFFSMATIQELVCFVAKAHQT